MNTRDDLEPEADRAIDELLDAAGEEAEAAVAEVVVPPPFAAVLDRARQLDPKLVDRQTRASIPPPADPSTVSTDLAPFVQAARAQAELEFAEQERHGPPGLPSTTRGASPWWIVGGVVALAAALLVWFGVPEVRNALRADAEFEGSQALDLVGAERQQRSAAERAVEPQPPVRPIPRRALRPAPLETISEEPRAEIPEEVAPIEAADPDPKPQPKPSTHARKSRAERRDEALRTLDDEAQRLLEAGDLVQADQALRTIVRRGGKSGLAQLAYGDLFTLAHRTGDRGEQRALWQQYLEAFPRGRFADDARAGLCRHAPANEQGGCWRRYLADFPTGAYHRQAMRAHASADGDRAPRESEP